MSQLNVRINHKYDTYEEWSKSSLVLGRGELAIVEIPSGTATPEGKMTPPAIGIKVGDGEKTFSQLKWIQATAGDVYSWAKEAEKPSYTAEEIEGLEAFIAGEIQDTNTTYTFEYANNQLIVKHKEKTEEEYTELVKLDINLTTKMDKDTDAVAGNLAQFDANGNAVDSGEKIGDFLKSADAASTYVKQTDYDAFQEAYTPVAAQVNTNKGDIATLRGEMDVLKGEGEGSVKKAAEDAASAAVNKFATDISDDQTVNSFKELVDWVAEHGEDAGEMAKGIQDNADAIAGLEEKAHTHTFNEDELNKIADGDKAKWDEAYAKRHEHSFVESELNKIVDGDVAKWNTGATTAAEAKAAATENAEAIAALEEKGTTWDQAVQSISGVTTEKTGTDVKVTAVPVNILQNVSGDTLILNCGTASTVI